jgi:hypothetical protein
MDGQLQDKTVDAKCFRCGGDWEDRLVRFCSCEAQPPLMIENVPARVCASCGTRVFADSTADVFEDIREHRFGQYRMAIMHVFDYEKASKGEPPVEYTTISTHVGPIGALSASRFTRTVVHATQGYSSNVAARSADYEKIARIA